MTLTELGRYALSMGIYPYSGYNFCMILDGYKIGFQKASGITLRNDNYYPYHEGGFNQSVSIFRNENKDYNELVLEKGVGFFNPTKLQTSFGVMLLVAYNARHEVARVYGFSGGIVSKITVSEFDASTSKVQIDTTSILYDSAFEIELDGNQKDRYMAEKGAGQTQAAMTGEAGLMSIQRIKSHNEKISKEMNGQNRGNSRRGDIVY